MKYGIMRIEKRKRADLKGIERECNRSEKINLIASDIDWNKTPENVSLVRTDNFKEHIEQELRKHNIKPRRDAVMMLDGIYTASPEFFKDQKKEDIEKYFTECVRFHEKYFGKVFNACIHLDERTPHLHVQSIPLIRDTNEKYRLSAKDIMGNKAKYHQMQDKFHEEISSKYNLERGRIRDNTYNREHLSVLAYKCEKAKEEELRIMSKINYLEEWKKMEREIDADIELEIERSRDLEKSRSR